MDGLSMLVLAETVQELTKTPFKRRGHVRKGDAKKKSKEKQTTESQSLKGSLGLYAGESLYSRDIGTLSQS